MPQTHVTLSLSTSVNAAYADVPIYNKRTGRRYTRRIASEALKTYKMVVGAELRQQGLSRGSWAHIEAIGYEAVFYVPTRARDLSNRQKGFEDALAAYLGFNDNKIVRFSCERRIDKSRPRIEVRLYSIEEVTA